MLQASTRDPQEIVGIIPPNQVACSVEKVAIQRGAGRVQAGISARGSRRGPGRVSRRILYAWRIGNDLVLKPGCGRQRPDCACDRHEFRGPTRWGRATAPTPP